MNDFGTLKKEEKVNLYMRRLYELYGYKKYRMNKFEEYSFYLQNKNFLDNDRFITFNDPDGRLMALKPDVTLSIAKNTGATGENQRIYYSESIFRTRAGASEFEELRQTGLEFIGKIDIYSMAEVISLALQTLQIISEDNVLSISHMGVISAMLDSVSMDFSLRRSLLDCIKGKNLHDLRSLCARSGVSAEAAERLAALVDIRGGLLQGVQKLAALEVSGVRPALDELKAVAEAFRGTDGAQHLQLDFSAVSSTDYYNGILLSGFVPGAASAVVTGGRYDNLLERMGKSGLNAMGFAVNFCHIERLLKSDEPHDHTVVLYDKQTEPAYLNLVMQKLTGRGERVRAVMAEWDMERQGGIIDITAGRKADL